MSTHSGIRIRTLVAGAGLAVAGSVAATAPAGAVSQASAEAQFSAAGIGWTSSGGCTDPQQLDLHVVRGDPAGHDRRRHHPQERQWLRD